MGVGELRYKFLVNSKELWKLGRRVYDWYVDPKRGGGRTDQLQTYLKPLRHRGWKEIYWNSENLPDFDLSRGQLKARIVTSAKKKTKSKFQKG